MKKTRIPALLIHFISAVCILVEVIIMLNRTISWGFLTAFGVSLFAFILSYFFMGGKRGEMSVTEQAYWYGFLIMSATYMKQFTSCISAANSSRVVSYFVVLLILIGYSFLCLWMSKNKFGKTLHILNIVIVSTYLIFELSELFSYYYIYV